MSTNITRALKMIEEQQRGKENSAVWFAGEQLKDIIGDSEKRAELVINDLKVKEMSLENCERQIKKRADEKREKGGRSGCVCINPKEAEEIIKKFYGITDEKEKGEIDIDDFFI